MEKNENIIVSFYREHLGLIRMLSVSQKGRLLDSMLSVVFDGVDVVIDDDPMLSAVFEATKAAAIRQVDRHNKNNRISNSMKGNNNASKHKVQGPENQATEQPTDVTDLY